MLRPRFNSLLFALAVAVPAGLSAQQAAAPPEGDSARVVIVPEKSVASARVLEWAVPTAGYGYAGNWKRGILPALLRVGGFVLVVSQQFVLFGDPPPCEGACILGAAMTLGGTLWAVVDVGSTVRRQNERRQAEADRAPGALIVPTLGPGGAGLSLRIPVSW